MARTPFIVASCIPPTRCEQWVEAAFLQRAVNNGSKGDEIQKRESGRWWWIFLVTRALLQTKWEIDYGSTSHQRAFNHQN
eukprot:scaffold13016_cov154-Amphora_coffeaeformis.AAC.2